MDPASHDSAKDRQFEAILHTYLQAVDAGQAPDKDALLRQHPNYASELAAFFASQDEVARLAQGMAGTIAPLRPAPEAPTPAAGEAPGLAPGTQVRYFGDYELLEEIARGGMGVVYKARQVSLNRLVALKMILAGQLAGDTEVQRFYAEAQIAANLQHPHIVAVHEVGEYEGQHYFSMDLVEGQSLADLIRDNTLEPKRAAAYVKIVAEAIQYAHEQGTLHRDLKPSNIIIDSLDRPRVTDFGLARRTEVDARLTASGAVLGTPSYLPPEQASGQRGRIGPASDVYSLGAMLYELVTGRPPFRAATPIDTILQVLSTPPLVPRLLNRKIDRNLETIILKCLAKEPAERYATARELAEDLQAFLDGRVIKARRPSPVERAGRWLRMHRRTLGFTAANVAVTALVVAGGILAWQLVRPKPEGEPIAHVRNLEPGFMGGILGDLLLGLPVAAALLFLVPRHASRAWAIWLLIYLMALSFTWIGQGVFRYYNPGTQILSTKDNQLKFELDGAGKMAGASVRIPPQSQEPLSKVARVFVGNPPQSKQPLSYAELSLVGAFAVLFLLLRAERGGPAPENTARSFGAGTGISLQAYGLAILVFSMAEVIAENKDSPNMLGLGVIASGYYLSRGSRLATQWAIALMAFLGFNYIILVLGVVLGANLPVFGPFQHPEAPWAITISLAATAWAAVNMLLTIRFLRRKAVPETCEG